MKTKQFMKLLHRLVNEHFDKDILIANEVREDYDSIKLTLSDGSIFNVIAIRLIR